MVGGQGTRAAYRVIREHIPYLDKDRELYVDIEAMVAILRSGELVRAVESMVGEIEACH